MFSIGDLNIKEYLQIQELQFDNKCSVAILSETIK